jgi:hypothetical protein
MFVITLRTIAFSTAPHRAAAILSNPAGEYFNVHTAIKPDGTVRGQLSAGTTASEPGYSAAVGGRHAVALQNQGRVH